MSSPNAPKTKYEKIHGTIRESDVIHALEKRYSTEEFAFFPHIPDATGFQGNRTADAVVMNLWPSRGLYLHGFEVKVRRNDWLLELKNPAKSAPVQQFCNAWWIAAAPDIVKEGELPPTWGLMVYSGKKLTIKKQAPELTPIPLDRAFIASLFRKAKKYVRPSEVVTKQVQDAYDRGTSAGRDKAEYEAHCTAKKLADLQRSVEDFKVRSGIDINDRWNLGDVSAAVKVIMDKDKFGGLGAEIMRIGNRAKGVHELCLAAQIALGEKHEETT